MTDTGIVYACSDERWLGETIFSAQSVAKQMPELAREIYLPEELLSKAPVPADAFTKIVPLKQVMVSHRPRFESFLQTELKQVLFLDGDTMLLEPIPEVFDLLKHFDLGFTIAPQLHSPAAIKNGLHAIMPQVSLALPEYNGGFILANVDDGFRNFIRLWLQLFEKCIKLNFTLDQPSLRVAVATSGLRVALLPNNYNFRANVPQSVNSVVKLLHAHADLPAISQFINETTGFRFYQPSEKFVYGFKPKAFLDQMRDSNIR